jgi:sortase A
MSIPPHKNTDGDGLSLSRPSVAHGAADSFASRNTSSLPAGPVRSQPSTSRRRRFRLPTVLASLLIAAGALLLLDAGVTLVWQEPVTALYAYFKQESLRGDLHALEHTAPTTAARQALERLHEQRRRIEYLAASLQRHAKNGSAVGVIHIPTIGANYVVVKGTGTSELESGPGIYSETNFPGIPGTTAIAGHRTTWLAPFRSLGGLRKDAPVMLDMPYARFTYRVIGSRVVLPTDVSVIDPVGYSRLVLSACTPPFSASHRLIVFARLISTVPLGAARVRQTTVSPAQAFSEERALQKSGLPPVLKSRQRLLAPLVS